MIEEKVLISGVGASDAGRRLGQNQPAAGVCYFRRRQGLTAGIIEHHHIW